MHVNPISSLQFQDAVSNAPYYVLNTGKDQHRFVEGDGCKQIEKSGQFCIDSCKYCRDYRCGREDRLIARGVSGVGCAP